MTHTFANRVLPVRNLKYDLLAQRKLRRRHQQWLDRAEYPQ